MKTILTAACVAALPMTALAQQAPTPELLQTNVTEDIGPYWSSSSFQIVSKAFKQDPLKPTFVARFQIAATNSEALYVPNGEKVGPEDVLVLTVPAKTTRTFYGTVNLAYSAGTWAGPTKIENPATKLGKPLDFYTVPTLVLGSDQYKQAVARQTAFSLDQRKAQFQKQLDAQQQTETTKLDDLHKAFEASLKATEDTTSADLQKQQAKIETLQTSDAAKIADIEKTYEAGLQRVNADFGDKLKQQQTALTDELGAELSKSQQALSDEQQKVEAARADLIAQQQDALAKLKLGLQSTQDAVAAKIKLARATVDAQNQLIALQKQVLGNNVTLVSMKSKLAEKFKAQLLSFEGTWGGTLRCKDKGGPGQYGISADEMNLTLAKQTGGALSGQMTVVGGDVGPGWGPIEMNKPIPASLQITNVNEKGPLQLEILTNGPTSGEKKFLNFEVQLDPSGVLKGNSVKAAKYCTVIFSR